MKERKKKKSKLPVSDGWVTCPACDDVRASLVCSTPFESLYSVILRTFLANLRQRRWHRRV